MNFLGNASLNISRSLSWLYSCQHTLESQSTFTSRKYFPNLTVCLSSISLYEKILSIISLIFWSRFNIHDNQDDCHWKYVRVSSRAERKRAGSFLQVRQSNITMQHHLLMIHWSGPEYGNCIRGREGRLSRKSLSAHKPTGGNLTIVWRARVKVQTKRLFKQ